MQSMQIALIFDVQALRTILDAMTAELKKWGQIIRWQ